MAEPMPSENTDSAVVVRLDRCTNRLCRVRNAIFKHVDEMASVESLLSELSPDDLRLMDPVLLSEIQHHIGESLQSRCDPRWLQMYVATLLRGIDIMETAVLDDADAAEMAHRFALAVIHAPRTVASHGGDFTTTWVGITAVILLVLILIAIVVVGVFLVHKHVISKTPSHRG
jgi:hypothetical protein